MAWKTASKSRVITVDQEKNKLVLSAKAIEKEKQKPKSTIRFPCWRPDYP